MSDSIDEGAKRSASNPLSPADWRAAVAGDGPPPMTAEEVAEVRARMAPVRTHEQKVELYLKTIAWFTGIVAVAVVANFIAAVVIGVAAAAPVAGY
ncbi:hypothetical protein G3T36_18320 [Diaminobutyricibacter tongyongensis]|uniref:Uncharacterized protein n=1 Tax=Leifsonia tongyongensis TaxID=1268043 RepID=A0A6L9Y2R8_9MICO|nr:hypothetical protein [Diaminobutyricibacter tongyongensis]NEN07815.1 hypothetical protein [Diaminobutyricibacter tongyongensis]